VSLTNFDLSSSFAFFPDSASLTYIDDLKEVQADAEIS
jgi:hypothetical protein